jgi:hypothetical protein
METADWFVFAPVDCRNGEDVVISLFPDTLVRLIIQITALT